MEELEVQRHWLLTAIVFLPTVGTLLIVFINKHNTKLIRRIAYLFSFATLALSAVLYWQFQWTLSGEMQFVDGPFVWVKPLKISYYLGVDGMGMALIVLTSLLTFLSVVYSPTAIREREKEYYALFLLLATGMNGVFCALDFILFYVFWEVSLVPMYFLIGVWGGPMRERAAIKFFLYTLFGSVAMLLAILYLYFVSSSHTFNMMTLIEEKPMRDKTMLAQGLVFIAFYLAFAIKVPVFPFHTWLPEAHVEAPTAGSVILAGILLKMGTYGFVRVILPMFPDACALYWMPVAFLALVNIIYGSLVAMAQNDMKKLVAYSSIGHMGFVMLGVAAAMKAFGDTPGLADDGVRDAVITALNGATWQMVAHGLMTGAMFLLVGVIYERAHHRDIDRFGGLWAQLPIYGSVLAYMSLAELGLPGLAGFWGEFWALLGSFKNYWFAAFGVAGIVITAGYFLWMVQRMLMTPIKDDYKGLPDMNFAEKLSLYPLVILVLLTGIFPHWTLLPPIDTAMKDIVQMMIGS